MADSGRELAYKKRWATGRYNGETSNTGLPGSQGKQGDTPKKFAQVVVKPLL